MRGSTLKRILVEQDVSVSELARRLDLSPQTLYSMTDELFRRMLSDAARDADVSLKQIEARQQGPDHPIAWDVPETDYLKFYLFQVV